MAIGRVQSVKISTHAAEEDDPARGRGQGALHGIVGFRAPPPTSKLFFNFKHFQMRAVFSKDFQRFLWRFRGISKGCDG
jgi:hypothetical protein